mmetsp:Transcript_42198/g.68358  ORF Transcript_42198/g.68358 Transcript_42198/m.68358 type:complete len:175 (-) Transcript_42198:37-561(-)
MSAAGSKNEGIKTDADYRRDLTEFGERGYVNSAEGLQADEQHSRMQDSDRAFSKYQKESEARDFRKAMFTEDLTMKLPERRPSGKMTGPAGPSPGAGVGSKRGLPQFMKLKSKDSFDVLPTDESKEKRQRVEGSEASPPSSSSLDAGLASPASSAGPVGTPLGLAGYASSSDEE